MPDPYDQPEFLALLQRLDGEMQERVAAEREIVAMGDAALIQLTALVETTPKTTRCIASSVVFCFVLFCLTFWFRWDEIDSLAVLFMVGALVILSGGIQRATRAADRDTVRQQALQALLLFDNPQSAEAIMKTLQLDYTVSHQSRSGRLLAIEHQTAARRHALRYLNHLPPTDVLQKIEPHRKWLYSPLIYLDAMHYDSGTVTSLLEFIRSIEDVEAVLYVKPIAQARAISLEEIKTRNTALACLHTLEVALERQKRSGLLLRSAETPKPESLLRPMEGADHTDPTLLVRPMPGTDKE